jgi:hypothetical protein
VSVAGRSWDKSLTGFDRSVGGMTGAIVTSPFDVVKVRRMRVD